MSKYTSTGALTIGLILIALGVIFLVENVYAPFAPLELIARYWPVCLIIIGLNKILAYFIRPKEHADKSDNAPSTGQSVSRERHPSLVSALLWTGLGVLFPPWAQAEGPKTIAARYAADVRARRFPGPDNIFGAVKRHG